MVVILAMGLWASAPVIAQDSSAVAEDSTPGAIAEDSGQVLTNRDAAVLVADALELSDQLWQGLFLDVGEGNEDAGAIEALALAGVITANRDGTFQPDDLITRGDFAVMVDRGFFSAAVTPGPVAFTDIPEGARYVDAAQHLYVLGVTKGCSADPLQFCGEELVTRWEAETLLGRAVEIPYVISDCEDPRLWRLLCDVYELIDTRYLPEITLEELAAPIDQAALIAAEGVDDLTPKRSRFVCSIPDPVFESACSWAVITDGTLAEAAEAAVREMLNALDRNSAYHGPEAWEDILRGQEGRYVGIGVRVAAVEEQGATGCMPFSETCRLTILTVFEGGPAMFAGFQKGDVILEVDGISINGMTIAQVANLIRGEIDTSVTITIGRDDRQMAVPLIRKEIITPFVRSYVHETESIYYLQLNSFAWPKAGIEFRQHLTTTVGALLIIDLRGNPGGSLLTLLNIVGALLGDVPGLVFHNADTSDVFDGFGLPLIGAETSQIAVLVDEHSASASEALAGVLQETGRAVIVGQATFGKNTGQTLLPLHNDGVLRLTTNKWTTPGGLDIGEGGLIPDIEIDIPDLDPQPLMKWVKDLLEQTPEDGDTPQE